MRSELTANPNDSKAIAEITRPDSQESLSPCRTGDHSTRLTEPRGAKSLMAVLSLALVLIFFAAAIPAPIRAAWDEFSLRMQLQQQSEPHSASPSKTRDQSLRWSARVDRQIRR